MTQKILNSGLPDYTKIVIFCAFRSKRVKNWGTAQITVWELCSVASIAFQNPEKKLGMISLHKWFFIWFLTQLNRDHPFYFSGNDQNVKIFLKTFLISSLNHSYKRLQRHHFQSHRAGLNDSFRPVFQCVFHGSTKTT